LEYNPKDFGDAKEVRFYFTSDGNFIMTVYGIQGEVLQYSIVYQYVADRNGVYHLARKIVNPLRQRRFTLGLDTYPFPLAKNSFFVVSGKHQFQKYYDWLALIRRHPDLEGHVIIQDGNPNEGRLGKPFFEMDLESGETRKLNENESSKCAAEGALRRTGNRFSGFSDISTAKLSPTSDELVAVVDKTGNVYLLQLLRAQQTK